MSKSNEYAASSAGNAPLLAAAAAPGVPTLRAVAKWLVFTVLTGCGVIYGMLGAVAYLYALALLVLACFFFCWARREEHKPRSCVPRDQLRIWVFKDLGEIFLGTAAGITASAFVTEGIETSNPLPPVLLGVALVVAVVALAGLALAHWQGRNILRFFQFILKQLAKTNRFLPRGNGDRNDWRSDVGP